MMPCARSPASWRKRQADNQATRRPFVRKDHRLRLAHDIIAETCDASWMKRPSSGFPGGKGQAFRQVINLMPPHTRYIEPFLGSGAVMRNKRPARTSIGIELDTATFDLWSDHTVPGLVVKQGDALRWLPRLGLGPGDLVYCDPPYVPSTRRRERYYRKELRHEDHVRLIELLLALRCSIVLSGYRNALYDEALRDWRRIDYRTMTHTGPVIESAWTNFEPGPLLHDYSYVGSNFREREGFRRRSSRLAQRLARTDALELHAALAIVAEDRPEAITATAERMKT